MKKVLVTILAMGCVLACTACTSEDATKSGKISNESVNITQKFETVTPQISELESFQQLISFYESDPNYNPDCMVYDIYIQKVEVYGEENKTQFVVGSRVRNTSNGKTADVTIAAEHDYSDPYRANGSYIPAKKVWYKDGVPYSAKSIIDVAKKEANISDDCSLYDRNVIISTF